MPCATPSRSLLTSCLLTTSLVATAQAAEPVPAAPVLALPSTTVEADREAQLQTQELPSYKLTAPLIDTPRSITVIPQEVIKSSGATTFTDALRTVPGITFLGGDAAANPSADRPVIRGFESRNSIFVDGMRDTGVQNRETFDVERISIIKGPDSVYAGRGAVGGSVDIETKAPKAQDFLDASVGMGTDAYKRTTLDVNRVIDQSTAFRLNVMGHYADQPGRTDVFSKRWGVAPSISFGLGGPTTVTLGYYHLSSHDMPDFSVPFRSTGGTPASEFKRKDFYGLNDRDYRRGQTDSGQVRIEHELDDDWKVRNTTSYGRSTLDYIATNPQFLKGSNDVIQLQAKSGKYATNTLANQTELTGSHTLFGLDSKLTTGIELSHEKSLYEGYLVTDSTGSNIRGGGSCAVAGNCTTIGGWDPDMDWTGSATLNGDSFPGKPIYTTTNMASAYAFDSLALSEKWLLNTGVRLDYYNTRVDQSGAQNLQNIANLFSYQVGLVYKPIDNLSLYTSYGTSANPPGANGGTGGGNDQLTANNDDLSPERSRNIEVGAKWDVLDGRLSLTSAIFQTDKTNARVSDGLGGIENAGSQRVRGVELGVAGELTPQWRVFGGYSYLNAVTTDAGDANESASGLPMVMVPKHNLTLWTYYDVTPKWTVGTGVKASSLIYASVSDTTRKWTPGYAEVDAMASYKVSKSLDVQLNLKNLFDRQYFASAYPIYATWAEGRSAQVTFNFHY
ncbi:MULTISPECIES: TonB-dependent receptor [unclassified Pseudomonas]|uniref:TonB-dependent receptor n=1 Tax=unclassified Pseudomonas TaxID=196821 RepID=UPI00257FF27A|nr:MULTISPECIES: TonB-dependent siderophore receptor [unclassified Pseudomonas]